MKNISSTLKKCAAFLQSPPALSGATLPFRHTSQISAKHAASQKKRFAVHSHVFCKKGRAALKSLTMALFSLLHVPLLTKSCAYQESALYIFEATAGHRIQPAADLEEQHDFELRVQAPCIYTVLSKRTHHVPFFHIWTLSLLGCSLHRYWCCRQLFLS